MSHTPEPWDYVPSTEHHGPYITSDHGSTICDLYVMSQPDKLSIRNGGPSKPIPFLAEMADPNAKRIVDCVNAMAGIDDPAKTIAYVKKTIRKALDQRIGDLSHRRHPDGTAVPEKSRSHIL